MKQRGKMREAAMQKIREGIKKMKEGMQKLVKQGCKNEKSRDAKMR